MFKPYKSHNGFNITKFFSVSEEGNVIIIKYWLDYELSLTNTVVRKTQMALNTAKNIFFLLIRNVISKDPIYPEGIWGLGMLDNIKLIFIRKTACSLRCILSGEPICRQLSISSLVRKPGKKMNALPRPEKDLKGSASLNALYYPGAMLKNVERRKSFLRSPPNEKGSNFLEMMLIIKLTCFGTWVNFLRSKKYDLIFCQRTKPLLFA